MIVWEERAGNVCKELLSRIYLKLAFGTSSLGTAAMHHRDRDLLDSSPLGMHNAARSSSPTLAKMIQKEELLASRTDLSTWARFRRKGESKIGIRQSLQAIAFSSCEF